MCSINYVLSNTDDKVTFKSFEESYRCALLNVQEEHSVTNLKEDRLLFKVSIFDKTYNEVLQILKTKKPLICEILMDPNEEQIPKAINKKDSSGKSIPTVFEDMYPFLSRLEFKKNLY